MDDDEVAILNFLEGRKKQHKEIIKVISDKRDRNRRTIEKKLEKLEERDKVERKESGREVYFQAKEDQLHAKRSGRESDSGIATDENINHLHQINDVTERIISEYHLDPDGILQKARARLDTPDSEEVYVQSSQILESLETLNQRSIDTGNNSAPQDEEYRDLAFSMLDNVLLLIQEYNKISSEGVSDNVKKIVKQGLAFNWNVAIDSENGSEYADVFVKKRDRMIDILTAEDTQVFDGLIYLIVEIGRLSSDTESKIEDAKVVAEYLKQVDSWDISKAYRIVVLYIGKSEERRVYLLDALEECSYTEPRQEKINKIIGKFGNGESPTDFSNEINDDHWRGLNRTDKMTLAVLSHGMYATGRIRELTEMPRSTVSKSVKRLKEKGWVKDGSGHGVYTLTEEASEFYQEKKNRTPEAEKEEIDKWIDVIESYLTGGLPSNKHREGVHESNKSIDPAEFAQIAIDYSFLLDDKDTRTEFFDIIREAAEIKGVKSSLLSSNREHAQLYLFVTASIIHENWMLGMETVGYHQEVNNLKEELCEYHECAPVPVREGIRKLIACVDIEKARDLFKEAIKTGEEPDRHLWMSIENLYEDRYDLDRLMALKQSLEGENRETKLIKSYFSHHGPLD